MLIVRPARSIHSRAASGPSETLIMAYVWQMVCASCSGRHALHLVPHVKSPLERVAAEAPAG